jgi:hypothetical protein
MYMTHDRWKTYQAYDHFDVMGKEQEKTLWLTVEINFFLLFSVQLLRFIYLYEHVI